jgi:putative Mg2+ transporter-C (MgtC) family protein
MPVTVEWPDVAWRLALTVAAGALLGLNRSERGRPAGLCTTSLVCLAASVAMILANVLLNSRGRADDSFVRLDPMRLPLGILTGMGFIGGGAIVRRGNLVQGVTTAATLWMATVIGLCLGGGRLALGVVALALATFILWGLKWLELRVPQDRRGTLTLCATGDGPTEEEVRTHLLTAGYSVTSWSMTYKGSGDALRRTMRCDVQWRARPADSRPPSLIHQFAQRPGVLALRWKGQG